MIDLDVLNPKKLRLTNTLLKKGGLVVEQVAEAIGFIKENLEISSATIAAFDLKFDSKGKTLRADLKLIRQILQLRVKMKLPISVAQITVS